jgi:hypothetical protein
LYPYSRCSYTKEIAHDDKATKLEWKKHIRSHYRQDPEDMPYTLSCWLSACPESHQNAGFRSVSLDVDDLFENFNNLLDHMLEHFQNEPQLSSDDLRKDDEDMLVTAWLRHEIWDAYHNPRVPEKHAERLSDEDFTTLGEELEAAGFSSEPRELIELRELEE